jgi:hypothetical protein
MRSKKRNLNIKILQNQIKNIALDEANEFPIKDKDTGSGITPKELPVVEKIPKKKGIKRDELINTKRLLTM